MKPYEIERRHAVGELLKWAAITIGVVIVLGLAAFGVESLIAVQLIP